ncbi:hypothetical protein [Planococcus sp. MB-3u-03]|uniref:hypothetical protein n=1 Tax=Planococcus sp. MB-3u-03 TaxID=2058136 RepID=UPI001E2AB453|nr:hypothetical protein [Planococcus sp. MB-3u-03]
MIRYPDRALRTIGVTAPSSGCPKNFIICLKELQPSWKTRICCQNYGECLDPKRSKVIACSHPRERTAQHLA